MDCLQTFGIDISSYSKQIDWNKVVTNLNPRFVFARAYHMDVAPTSSYEDPLFANDYWPALAGLNVHRGAYLFCHPKADATDSINKFFSVYAPKVGDLVPTLDIEDIYDNSCGVPLTQRIAQIDKMVQLVSVRIGGLKPIIYTKKRVWNDLGNPDQFSSCPLWILNYNTMPTTLNMPTTWKKFVFWQYAENLKVDGIGGDYDPNLFNGAETELQNYIIKRLGP